MSDPLTTNHLKLPYLAAAQAQKHVTHNEALTLLDTAVQLAVLDASLTAPPGSPADGDRYIVAASATGDWASRDGAVATWADGAWTFATPEAGWLAFDVATATLLAFVSGTWAAATGGATTAAMFGINTTADSTNRLSVRSAAALFSGIAAADGGTGDMRVVIDKEADGDTASLVFQSGWSGRAEIGLAGDTDLVVKVSADGSTWTEAVRIDKTSGHATILYDHTASGLTATSVQAAIDEIAAAGAGAVASVFGRTGTVAAAASDYDASQVDNDSSVSGATVKDALNTLSSGKQAAAGDLTAIAGLSPANDDVVQRKAGAWTNRTPAQLKADLAIAASDIVAAVSNTEFGYLDGVTSAIQTQINAKAPLASPTFTGTPAAPTAAVDTNTTQVATTAFVLGQASASGDGTPAMDGTAARGTSTHFARADHIHPTDTSRAPLASPTFTGTPAAPTATGGTNTTQIATTAFVTAAVAALSTVYQAISTILTAIAALGTSGLIARTGSGTVAARTVTGPAAGITVTNGDGVSGNPTLALANDLSALEGLGSTGLAARTAADTWAQRTVTGTANEIGVTNGDGVSGNPTVGLASAPTVQGLLTLAAGQIKFPATQNPSADANTLDDYEEGTFTPTAAFATPGTSSWAYTQQWGYYTKIGCFIQYDIHLVITPTIGTGSGDISINGLPYTVNSDQRMRGIAATTTNWTWGAGLTQIVVVPLSSGVGLGVTAQGSSATPANLGASNMTTGSSHVLRAHIQCRAA